MRKNCVFRSYLGAGSDVTVTDMIHDTKTDTTHFINKTMGCSDSYCSCKIISPGRQEKRLAVGTVAAAVAAAAKRC